MRVQDHRSMLQSGLVTTLKKIADGCVVRLLKLSEAITLVLELQKDNPDIQIAQAPALPVPQAEEVLRQTAWRERDEGSALGKKALAISNR